MPSERIRPGRWTAEDILSNYPRLGVPHFQRGLVWGSDSVSLLLESLYYSTPCGGILLWEPLLPAKEGVAFPGAKSPSLLILDGQQRIRSVHQSLGEAIVTEEAEEDGEGDVKGEKLWCLNLSRVPELAADPELGKELRDGARYPMFRLIRDPRDPDAAFKYNLIPLEILRRGDEIPRAMLKVGNATERLATKLKEIHLAKRVRQMTRTNLFDVQILKETEKVYRLPDVVSIYNRINSGGRRVESEEVAFSTLVSLSPGTGEWLREVFEKIHPPGDQLGAAEPSRDDVLRRRKEKAFGFKLILRTFIQVCSYHFGYSLGSNSISFDVVDSPTFRGDLVRAAELATHLRDRTSDVLSFIRKVLKEQLRCDDLQMLPETTALLPVFQLLIRFPGLLTLRNGAEITAFLILRLLLLPRLSQSRALKLVEVVNRCHTAAECVRALSRATGEEVSPQELRRDLANSNSLQDRYILLLYWLTRKNEALDMTYAQLKPERRQAMLAKYGKKYETPVLIEESVGPEKQHLVPYTELRKLLGIRSRGRVSRHPANNIGNITFLSHAMNDFKTGLGGDVVDLSLEPVSNLKGHFLLNPNGQPLTDLFAAAGTDTRGRSRQRRAFEKFTKARRELIAAGFEAWVTSLEKDAAVKSRIEPDPRLDPQDEDFVRAFNLPDTIEDPLLACAQTGRLRLSRTKSSKRGVQVFQVLDEARRKSIEVGFPDDPRGIEIRLRESKLAKALFPFLMAAPLTCMPGRPGADELLHKSRWLLSVEPECAESTSGVLRQLAKLLGWKESSEV